MIKNQQLMKGYQRKNNLTRLTLRVVSAILVMAAALGYAPVVQSSCSNSHLIAVYPSTVSHSERIRDGDPLATRLGVSVTDHQYVNSTNQRPVHQLF